MVAVCGGQVRQVGAVLAEQRVRREVSTKAARGDDHGTMLLECLAIARCALDTAHIARAVREELVHLGLEQDPGGVRFLSDLLQLLHEPVCNGHAWEALLAAVSAGHRMATQAGDEAEVNAELVDDPIHRWGALVAEHVHKVWTARTAAHGVLRKDLRAIADLECALTLRERTVD